MDGSDSGRGTMKATILVTSGEIRSQEVILEDRRYRHLFRARRASTNIQLRLTDGAGQVSAAQVAEIGPKSARITARGEIERVARPAWVGLIVPVLKPERTAWMVEKCTELEVAEIRFYSGARAPRKLTSKAIERLQRVASSALVQSHGSWLPQILPPRPLSEVLDAVPGDIARYVCDGNAPQPRRVQASALWAVGAEGGWTEQEARGFTDAGFTAVGFGRGVLRSETCSLAAVVCSKVCGDVN